MSVIQFNGALFKLRDDLKALGYINLKVPQERPRCGGETLGCTSAVLEYSQEKDTVIFLADGRFHMEGAMIANPKHTFFKYHPYEQVFTLEEYDFPEMIKQRKRAIDRCAPVPKTTVGVILGVLGRQGSQRILEVG